MAKVNILIPVYNGERYLEETVGSILSQTFADFTALFVDDGSTDNSVDILKKAAAGDNRIVVVEKPHEGSVPFTWNYIFRGLTLNGLYICRMMTCSNRRCCRVLSTCRL